MKKGIFCVLVCILMIVSAIIPVTATTVSEKTSQPMTTESILYVGGSGPNNYTKIQDAINDTTNGDTVFVYDDSSPYEENLVVDKSITLLGENKDTTILHGINPFNRTILIQASSVTFEGFTITDSCIAIRIESDNNIITGNKIFNNTCGIYLNSSIGNVISGNLISSNMYDGVKLIDSESLVTLNNITGNGRSGVYIYSFHLHDNDNSTIEKNNIVGNGIYGVEIYTSKNSIVQNNIYNNQKRNAWMATSIHLVDILQKPFDNKWNGNYWGHPYESPVLIIGGFILAIPSLIFHFIVHNILQDTNSFGIIYIPVISLDKNPAQEPYDISGTE